MLPMTLNAGSAAVHNLHCRSPSALQHSCRLLQLHALSARFVRLQAVPAQHQQHQVACSQPGEGALQWQQLGQCLHRIGAGSLTAGIKRQIRSLKIWCKQHKLQTLMLGTEPASAMAAMALLPALPGGGFSDLFTNRVFLAGFWAWFTAQTLKIFTKRIKKGMWDIRAIVDSGGMPSSHSALCAGITTAIAYQHGLGSSAFALALAVSSIVMYDAAGVRRHAGKQAEVLNQVIGELLDGHPVSETKLKEVLGHTPLQVCAGAVLGVLFGIYYPAPGALAAAAVAAEIMTIV
eukprot:GHRR01001226.1.p1 GENE.GHRR01001226.1~~GHRR01001226.1.p1  ORF type:complete len:291 (+),score=85.33 GHRR01001226.1:253-1125(+)